MNQDDVPSEKRRLRQAAKRLLEPVTPDLSRAAGVRIAERLVGIETWRVAPRIVLYSPRPDEVDPSSIRARALEDGKRVLLPRMCSAGGLEFAEAGDPGHLRKGRFGVVEPTLEVPALRLAPSDLVLVPGLAFDRLGGRLGRGGGYYDRAFASSSVGVLRPVLIGMGFSFQVVERVPMTDLDVRLDGFVSEIELVWAGVAGPGADR